MEGTTKIKDVNPYSRRVNVLGKVVEVGQPKEITTRFGEGKSVTEVVIGDETGKITLSLWGDQVSKVESGKTLYIDNGYISLVRGHMRLNVGKYGNLNDSEEAIEELNTELDMSEKVHESNYRRSGPGSGSSGGFRRGGSGGGSYRRGGFNQNSGNRDNGDNEDREF
jgi:Single-stranded DNA-binding replication protein A (RPA), large (70 kD) subunit and related ssDNA-binding proteins